MEKNEVYAGHNGNASFGKIITSSISAWKFNLTDDTGNGKAAIKGLWNLTNTAFPGVEDTLRFQTTEGFEYIGRARLFSMQVICKVDNLVKVKYRFRLLETLKIKINKRRTKMNLPLIRDVLLANNDILTCPNCHTDLYRYVGDHEGIIKSADFIPLSENIPQLQKGDELRCPLCDKAWGFAPKGETVKYSPNPPHDLAPRAGLIARHLRGDPDAVRLVELGLAEENKIKENNDVRYSGRACDPEYCND